MEERLKGEGKVDVNSKHTHLSTNNLFPQHRYRSSSLALGECSEAPICTSSSPSPESKQQGPLGGDCMFPMQLVTETQAPRPLWVAQISHSPKPGFLLPLLREVSALLPSHCPHLSDDSTSQRAGCLKCLLSATPGLSVCLLIN